MYIFKNAIKNIKNSAIRSVLLGVIITVISLICCMSLALLNISQVVEEEALRKASATSSITKKIITGSNEIMADPVYDELEKFSQSEYIYDTYLYISDKANILNKKSDITLIGYNSDMSARHFLFSDNVLMSGQMPNLSSDAKECIITDMLSMQNDLQVGDTISMQSDDKVQQLTITGLYKGNEANQNDIITSFDTFKSLIEITDHTNVDAVFVFNNPNYIEPFEKYVTQNNTDETEYRVLFSGIQKLREYFSPIQSTRTFAILSFALSLIVGGIILIVLSIFNIHDRKYEVGVLSAMGMPKSKIMGQFVAEMFTITSICIIIGIAISVPVSIITSRSMLSPTMHTNLPFSLRIDMGLQDRDTHEMKIGYVPDEDSDARLMAVMNTESKTIDKVKAVINGETILKITCVGLLLTIISSLASIIFIVRFKPLQILTKRTN